MKKGTVPDLTSVRLDDALAALTQAGLSYVVVETDKAKGTPGVVASQDPAPGTKGGQSTSVTLVVPAAVKTNVAQPSPAVSFPSITHSIPEHLPHLSSSPRRGEEVAEGRR